MAIEFVQQSEISSATDVTTLTLPSIDVTAGNFLILQIIGPKPFYNNEQVTSVTIEGATFTFAAGVGGLDNWTAATAMEVDDSSIDYGSDWGFNSGTYLLQTSAGEWRMATVTNGSPTIELDSPLTEAATTAFKMCTNQGLLSYICEDAGGGATEVTVSTPNDQIWGLLLQEWSGVALSDALLAAKPTWCSIDGSGTDVITPPMALETDVTPDAVVAFTVPNSSSADLSAGTGYTGTGLVWDDRPQNGLAEYATGLSGTSFSPAFSCGEQGEFSIYFGSLLALKAAGTADIDIEPSVAGVILEGRTAELVRGTVLIPHTA